MIDTLKDRDRTHEATRQFVEEVVACLETSFPDAGILHALTLFDPSHVSRDTSQDLVRYSALCMIDHTYQEPMHWWQIQGEVGQSL